MVLSRFSGGGGIDNRIRIVHKAVNESITEDDTLSDDNDLHFDLAANTKYLFILMYQARSPTASGFKRAFGIPAGSSAFMIGNNVAYNQTALIDDDLLTSSKSNTTGNTNRLSPLMGYVITTNAGELVFQWAQATNTLDTTILQTGSIFILIEVGPV